MTTIKNRFYQYLTYTLLGFLSILIISPFLYVVVKYLNRLGKHLIHQEFHKAGYIIRFLIFLLILSVILFLHLRSRKNIIYHISSILFTMWLVVTVKIFARIIHIGGSYRDPGYFEIYRVFSSCDICNHYSDEYVSKLTRGYINGYDIGYNRTPH